MSADSTCSGVFRPCARSVARDRARASAFSCASEQTVDLVGERLHLARRRHVEPRGSPGDDIADRDPQALAAVQGRR